MDNQKMRLKYNKNHSIQNKTNNRDNIIKDKNQLNDNKNNVCQLSTSVLDQLKVFYNTSSDNKIHKHSTHTLKITKSNSRGNNTTKQSTKHKEEASTSKIQRKKFNLLIFSLTKIFNQHLTSIHYLYLSPKIKRTKNYIIRKINRVQIK